MSWKLLNLARKPAILAAFVILLLIMAAAGFAGINADSLWYDEYMSLYFAGWPSQRFDLGQVFERLSASHDYESATYYLILAGWARVAGWSVYAARLLSMFFGLLAAAWAYRLGRDLHSSAAGLASAALLGGSALQIVDSHELRMYSFWPLATLVILWLYWTSLRRGLTRLRAAAFFLAILATLFAHPLAIVWIGALGLYHLFRVRSLRDERNGLLILIVAASTLYLPLGISSVAFAIGEVGNRELTARATAELMLSLAQGLSNGFWPILLLPLLAWRRLQRDHGLRLLWFVGACSFAVVLVANYSTGIVGHVRYLLPVLPLFAVCGGVGVACLPAFQKIAAATIATWCFAGLLAGASFSGLFYQPAVSELFHIDFPFQELVSDLRRDGGDGDAAVFEFPYHSWALQGVIDYYMRGSSMRYILADTLRAEGDWQATLDHFERFIGDSERLYFVLDRTIEATPFVPEYERLLEERFVLCARLWDTAQAKVDKYTIDDPACRASE